MKLEKVTVSSLFGVFDHEIPFKVESGITIVIGENGLGKTVILEAINALFDKKYSFFGSLEFEAFNFYFSNGEIWQLTKTSNKDDFTLSIGRDSTNRPVKKIKTHKIFQANDSFNHKMRIRDREILRRHEMERFFRSENGYYRDEHEFEVELHHRRLMESKYRHHRYAEESELNVPQWYLDGINKVNVRLIETQRIITAKESGSDSYVNNLNKCSQELKEMIDLASRKSSKVATELDSTYPNRLVKKLRQGSQNTFDELNKALAKLDDRRKQFSSSGLAVKVSDSDLLQINETQENLVNVLKLYIDDSHKKLDPYEELSQKIKLFKGIVNKRFKHKTLEVEQDKGLSFRSTIVKNSEGLFDIIPPSKLSSGEQHELILFYKLIFNSQSNDLILIDEPELSLHISWQNKFIKDLKEVSSINDISIVIATHSPDIIDENWDLKVELLGVE
ncbi:AAA family ATPase [Pseudoalteromonas carrageenovora]|uniref:AAA family ATPase n=1 Tax=Pseudoalteromonas TaxID=53246 RepID=UPI0026E25200|nr:AAA family ATPase [Pseudoalteromonas carrageenovora]MDO6636030.1 AAA family ATPase [Pseudoalteromonas carrageenovora]MDO6646951.1 AAA family ATPase [Pseudoalteromonas carrageenovora]